MSSATCEYVLVCKNEKKLELWLVYGAMTYSYAMMLWHWHMYRGKIAGNDFTRLRYTAGVPVYRGTGREVFFAFCFLGKPDHSQCYRLLRCYGITVGILFGK